jgi:hypothetical protein
MASWTRCNLGTSFARGEPAKALKHQTSIGLAQNTPLDFRPHATWAEVVDLQPDHELAPDRPDIARRLHGACDLRHRGSGAGPFFPIGDPTRSARLVSKCRSRSLPRDRQDKIPANRIDPSIVRTRLRAGAFPSEDPTRRPLPESVTDAFLALALPGSTRNSEVVAISNLVDRL